MKCIKCQELKRICKKCYDKNRYESNKEEIRKRNKKWAQSHKDVMNKHSAKWRLKNKTWIKDWHRKNRKKINRYWRNRKRNEPTLRLHSNISRNIHNSLNGTKAGNRWESLVGYTVNDLIRHLESKFKKGMTWDDYGRGGWHIDHIIPKSHFQIEDANSPDFKKCWSLDNLQPLWEHENCSKQDNFIG